MISYFKKIALISIAVVGIFFAFSSQATDGNINVNFTVPSAGGGGGGSGGGTPPTNNPPVISNVVVSVGITTSTITWSATDDIGISSSNFVYGTTVSYGSSGTISGSYVVNLSGLITGTLYYYRITLTDTNSATAEYSGSFTTALDPSDITPPVISNVNLVVNSQNRATVTWDTNELADSQIRLGLTTAYSQNLVYTEKLLAHTIVLISLIPNTTYHYKLYSTDSSGNTTSTADATFTTLPDTLPPPNVFGFNLATTSNSIILNWESPYASDFAGVKILRKVGSQSTGITDGTVVYTGSAPTFTDTEVLVNVNYYYTIYSFDTSGNYSSGVYKNGKIIPPPATEVCTNGIDDDTNGFIDCADSACSSFPACSTPPQSEICNNGIDDNSNGATDCADSACSGSSLCMPAVAEICNNGTDDDADATADCLDSDCAGSAYCAGVLNPEICDNGTDDDTDGKIDCLDESCFGFSGCGSQSYVPACRDSADNDSDSMTDYPADTGCENSDDNDEYNPPQQSVPSFAQLSLDDFDFFIGNRQIQIIPANGSVSALSGTDLTIVVEQQELAGQPKTMVIKIGDTDQNLFIFDVANQKYYATVSFSGIGEKQAYIEVDYGSDQFDSVGLKLNNLPNGDVLDNKGNRLDGAELILFYKSGGRVLTENFGQPNPAITGVNGNYGWVVQNGEYYVEVRRDGFYDRTTGAQLINNNTINFSISMVAKPPKLADVIDPEASIGKNVGNVAKNLVLQTAAISQVTAQQIQAIADNPVVEKLAEKTAPTVVSVAVAAAIPLISWLDLLPFLRFLFLQPLMLLGWRKRAKWGLVYNALNKQPVDLVIIRLINAETGRVVQSKVTDAQGHYIFIVDPGKYKIEARKSSFVFPSDLLKGLKSDGQKTDIYHGEIIEVAEKNASITANIPLDPVGSHKKPARILWERFGRRLQVVLSWAGILVTGISLYISPKWYLGVLLAVHLGMYFLFRKLALPSKTKSWGIVADAGSNKPISKVVARLFNSQYNKLVSTQVTDAKGRYFFLAGDDSYYVTYEHKDYQPLKTGVIDLKGKPSETIASDIKLKKH